MRIVCPCGKALRVKDELAGKMVKCPGCGARILVDEEEPELEVEEPEPALKKRNRAREDSEDEPSQRKKKKKKTGASSPILWYALGGGGALVIATAAVLFLVFNRGDAPSPNNAGGNKPTDKQPSKEKPALTGLLAQTHVRRLAYTPDGKRLATFCYNNRETFIKVWEVNTGQEVVKFDWDKAWEPTNLSFSPDGNFVASSASFQVKIWDVGAKTLRSEAVLNKDQILGDQLLAFSTKSKSVLVGGQQGFFLMDIETGKLDELKVSMPLTVRGAASPTEPLLAIGQYYPMGEMHLTLFDYETKAVRHKIPMSTGVSSLAFSRDGRTLAVATVSGPIELYETVDLKLRNTLRREAKGYFERVAWNKDGSMICGIPYRKGITRPQGAVWSLDSKEPRMLSVGWTADMAFSPDRGTLGVARYGEPITFLDPTTGNEKAP